MDASDRELAATIERWKDRILHRAVNNIEQHFLDSPVEDFSQEEHGFERGLRTAVDEICKLMVNPSYFNRSASNEKS